MIRDALRMDGLRPRDEPPADSRCGQDNPQQGRAEEKRIPDNETDLIDRAPALDVLPVLVREDPAGASAKVAVGPGDGVRLADLMEFPLSRVQRPDGRRENGDADEGPTKLQRTIDSQFIQLMHNAFFQYLSVSP